MIGKEDRVLKISIKRPSSVPKAKECYNLFEIQGNGINSNRLEKGIHKSEWQGIKEWQRKSDESESRMMKKA